MKKVGLLRQARASEQGEPVSPAGSTWTLQKGLQEAHAARPHPEEGGIVLDPTYTSVLKRAMKTLWVALEEMDQMWIPLSTTAG